MHSRISYIGFVGPSFRHLLTQFESANTFASPSFASPYLFSIRRGGGRRVDKDSA